MGPYGAGGVAATCATLVAIAWKVFLEPQDKSRAGGEGRGVTMLGAAGIAAADAH